MTEQEYKNYIYEKADNVRTKEDLDNLLAEVVDSHEAFDYGKICYAISACMLAALNYVDRSEIGGITGFQASVIGWEMVRQLIITDKRAILRLVNYDNMLYPQYKRNFDKVIDSKLWEKLQKQAAENLEKHPDAHPNVTKHWQSIVDGKVPFGFKIEGE